MKKILNVTLSLYNWHGNMIQSSVLYLLGSLLFIHAAYSSFEFHQLLKTHIEYDYLPLPTEITVEVILALVTFIIGSIISVENGPKLSIDNKLIQQDDKYLKKIEMRKAMREFEKIGISGFEEYDSRVDFIDIKQKRKRI